MSHVRRAEAAGDECFHRLSEELVPLVSEQPLGLGIHERDLAAAIDDHDSIRR